ncbi:hypothetical protein Tco_1428567 [Tanacetum coccineum]
MCPLVDDSSPIFATFSTPLFDTKAISPSDNESFSDEDVPKENFKIYSNPLFDEEIISTKIDPHCFNAESYLIESLLNRDALIDSSPKFYYLLEEFSGELAHTDPIPPGVVDTDSEPEEEIRLAENLSYDNSSPRPPEERNSEIADTIVDSLSPPPIPVEDSESLMEEINLFLAFDDSMPSGIEIDDYDSKGDICFLEELLSNDSPPLPENESFSLDHFDDPSLPRPPPETHRDVKRIENEAKTVCQYEVRGVSLRWQSVSTRYDVAVRGGRHVSTRYVVPTGRVVVPTGRYIVPASRVVVPTGRYIVHAGKVREGIKARTPLLQSIPNDHVGDFIIWMMHRISGMQSKLVLVKCPNHKRDEKVLMLKQEFPGVQQLVIAGEFLSGVTSDMKVVPPPLSGDYTPLSDHTDLDESQMSYGTKSSTSGDSNSVSNDFVSCDNSDKSSEPKSNDSKNLLCIYVSSISTSDSEAEIGPMVGTPIQEPIIGSGIYLVSLVNSSDKNENSSRNFLSTKQNAKFNKILMDSPEVNDGSEFWKNQHTWSIQNWKLYSFSGVHVLETVSGLVIHMFVDKKYPLSINLIERMLDHQLEICHGTMGNELTTVVVQKSVAGSGFPEGSSMLLTFDVQRHSAAMCSIFKCSSSCVQVRISSDLDVAVKFIFQSSRYVVPTSIVVVPTSRYIVPAGRVVVPTGRYIVPAGKVIIIVSTGRLSLVPYGRST